MGALGNWLTVARSVLYVGIHMSQHHTVSVAYNIIHYTLPRESTASFAADSFASFFVLNCFSLWNLQKLPSEHMSNVKRHTKLFS